MSNFTTDNSAQLTYTPTVSFSYNTITTPEINFNGTSGIYNPSINNIKIFTNNTDALTIDSNQCLYGNGTGLTNIGYNNVINKPTNFQTDWSTTIINKPTNFQTDWATTIINKPTNFQSDWLTTIINKPSTFPVDTTLYYNKTDTNNLLGGKQATLTASTTLLGNGSGITALTYGNITGVPDFLLKSGGTMTGAIVNTSTTTSEFKAIQIAHAARQSHLPYLPNGQFYFRAPVNIDNDADYLSMGSRLGNFIIKLFGEDYGFGINSLTLRYNAGLTASHKFYTGSTNTFTINGDGNISTLGTITEAGTLLTSKYLKLDGTNTMTANANITLSGTGTFTGIHSGNGAGLTNLPLSAYSTTGNDANYLLKSGGTLTGTLNGTTIYTTGNIGVGTNNNIASLVVGNIDADGSDGSIAFSKRQNVGTKRNFKMGMNGDYTFCIGDYGSGNTTANYWSSNHFNIRYADGNVGIGIQGSGSYKLYVDGTTYFNGASTVNGTLTATTFSGSGASLTNLPLSAYSTTGNDANYLLKTGGVMTGQITGITTVNGTTGIFSTVSTTNNGNANTPQLGVFGGTGDRFILYVGTAALYPYSLGINSDVLWYSVPATASHIFYVGGSPKATISSTGLSTTGLINASTNLQEAGVNLTSKYLQLSGGTLTGALTINADFRASNIQVGGATYQLLITPHTATKDYTEIQTIQQGIGFNQKLVLQPIAGNVGIGIISPETKIDVNGSILLKTALATSGGTAGIFFRNGYTSTSVYNCSILTYDHNADTFCDGISINGYDGVSICTGSNIRQERMRINVSGNVGIGTTDPQSKLEIFDATNPKIFLNQNGTTRCFISGNSLGLDFGNDIGTSKIIRFMPDNVERVRIAANGNVGIGTNNPNNILQVGDGGKLRISNGITDYSLIGTKDVDDTTNTRIVVSGNTRSGYAGQIQYLATSGDHIFYTSATTERMRILNNGNVGIGTNNPRSLFNITGTNPILTIMGQGGSGAKSQLDLATYDNTTFLSSCSLIATDTGSFGSTFQIKQKTSGANANAQFTSFYINDTGATAIAGSTINSGYRLTINGSTYLDGALVSTAGAYFSTDITLNGSLNFGNRIQDYLINLWGSGNYGFGINSSTLRYNSDGVHKFYCGGAESTTIDNKGIVIGTFTNHYYPLAVNKTLNGTLSYVYVRTGYNGGSDYNTNSYTADISAAFAGAIYVSANIINSSDIRIKKEINDINDDGALQQILAIEPKTYKYIDYLSKGNSTVYGFIAQQVKEVIPHAVEFVKDIIPNIYKRAICSSNIITLENDVSQDLNINDNIKIYDEFGNDNMYNITEINENVITIDKDINTSNVFVFGKEIEDFHTLKKDYIFTLNVCATQELYKLIQKQNEVIENLQLQINELKNILK